MVGRKLHWEGHVVLVVEVGTVSNKVAYPYLLAIWMDYRFVFTLGIGAHPTKRYVLEAISNIGIKMFLRHSELDTVVLAS